MSAPSPSIMLTLDQIHQLVGGDLHGNGTTPITTVDNLSDATAETIAFVTSDKDLKIPDGIKAGALLAHRHLSELPIPHIVVTNPKLAWARVAQRLVPPYIPRGIAADLARGRQVEIGSDVSIWPSVTLGDHVTIGARVTLYPGVFVGSDSAIGDDSILYPNVVIREGCSIGARVIIHSGTVVGSDGFGYAQDQGRHVKIRQLGGVAIEDDVEIGANVTIDRATTRKKHTRIQTGTKVDNLVQIAHNVTIGAHSIVVAQVGIAGSTTIGQHVMIGGQAGLADHITIGDQVMIAARAGVNRSLEPNQIVSGAPVMPHETWMKAQAVIPRLPELRQLVRSLEQRVATLETQLVQTPRASKKASTRARK